MLDFSILWSTSMDRQAESVSKSRLFSLELIGSLFGALGVEAFRCAPH